MNAVIFVLCIVLATVSAVPVPQNGTGFSAGLGAALTNIANSFVVVSEEAEQLVSSRIDAEPSSSSVPHLESANALPSLVHISLTPEEHHIKAETEQLVYTNDTDAQGVVKITIVGEDISEEFSTDDTPTTVVEEDDDDDATVTEAAFTTTETEDEDGLTTTIEPITTSTPKVLSSTPAAVLTVLGSDQVDKEKEEEIKANIKEVEAMPVIFTSGV